MRRRRLAAIAMMIMMLLLPLASFAQEDAMAPDDAAVLVTQQNRKERALLIGIDEFVTKPSTYPSSTNNVYAMQAAFQGALNPLETMLLPSDPVTSAEKLTSLIQETFGEASEGDVSYLYISTHGVFLPDAGEEPKLLLSDGVVEGDITPTQLEAAFDGIAGTKVIILDACSSGAFIGKGLASQTEAPCFLGDDFKVLTSSGAMEESWYWSAEESEESLNAKEPQGAYYFTQMLTQSLSAACDYPADQNHDGSITLAELYDYLRMNHAASSPQVYPQSDDFVIFRYDVTAELPLGMDRAPIIDVTFSGTVLNGESREITLEFIAMRPIRVAYQIVYLRDGQWRFDEAQLIYDQAERFTAFGDQEGAISPGRKVRTLTVDELIGQSGGYIMAQLVSIDRGKLTIHGGRVLCVPPAAGDLNLTVKTPGSCTLDQGRELSVFVGHNYPCALSVAILDVEDRVVYRLCHKQGTRPIRLEPEGSVFYWDGRQRDGELVSPGTYRVRAQAEINNVTVTAYSEPFTVEEE